MEDVRAYRDTGAIPRSADPLGDSSAVANMADFQAREAERRAEQERIREQGRLAQQRTADSQVQPSSVGYNYVGTDTHPTVVDATEDLQMQDADSQVEAYTTGVSPNAPPGTVPGGIANVNAPATPATPATPAGQAPAAPAASTGVVSSSRAPAAMAGGAVPIANPGDPMGWGAYKANVEDLAKLDPEQKAILDDMRKRTERKMSRAEKQEKNVMSEAMIAGGLAMMGGLNLSDGVRRLAMGGGQKYFESSAAASKAIEAADDAQGAFDQYQLSLKQGNKKVAADMYGKYFNTMADFQGKIQAASISAGASREATAENRLSREQQAQLNREQQAFQNSEAIRIREAQIQQNQQQFVERMTAQGETQKANDFYRLQTLKQDALGKVDAARNRVLASIERDPAYTQLYSIPENKLTPDQRKQKNVLDARIAKNLADATKPFMDEISTIVNRQSTMMGLTPTSGGNIPTYDPATGKFK